MSIGAVCNREVIVTGPETTAREAAELMRAHHVGDIVVVEEKRGQRRPIGLITDRDLVIEVIAEGIDPASVTVAELMTRDLETIEDGTDFWDVLSQMRACGVRRIPIVNKKGGLEGIFTFDDALELIREGLCDLGKVVDGQIARERRARPSPLVT
jgi:CBS domain-containing protein